MTDTMKTPGPLVGGPRPQQHRSRRRMTVLRRLTYAIIAPIGVAILRLLWMTYRFEIEIDDDFTDLDPKSQPIILSFWHDSIFPCAYVLRSLSRQGFKVTFLVSPSADGELAVRLLRIMGWQAVRGSATRSGVKAMHGMYRAIAKRGESPVVVPDGPQGPPREAKLGSILLARLAGVKVVPIGFAARSSWRLKTWDRLYIPKPLTRVKISIGRPFGVANDSPEDENETKRRYLEHELDRLSQF